MRDQAHAEYLILLNLSSPFNVSILGRGQMQVTEVLILNISTVTYKKIYKTEIFIYFFTQYILMFSLPHLLPTSLPIQLLPHQPNKNLWGNKTSELKKISNKAYKQASEKQTKKKIKSPEKIWSSFCVG